jgi:hypothetical protein
VDLNADVQAHTHTPSHEPNEWMATCAPSVAVALLMARDEARRDSDSKHAARAEPARVA